MKNIAKALVNFQKNLKDPSRDSTNPFFNCKYVTLDNLLISIRPILAENGLCFVQIPCNSDDKVGVTTILFHESGEELRGEPFYMKPSKNDPQGYGACITYARRYSLSAMLGVAWDDDDDGNEASNLHVTKLKLEVNALMKKKKLEPSVISEMVKHFGKNTFDELNVKQAESIKEQVSKL